MSHYASHLCSRLHYVSSVDYRASRTFTGNSRPVVFYIGDHDPSGHDIERDIHKRAQQASGKEFEIERLAIHAADIKAFATDSRAVGFEKQFGADAPTVELDALPVVELRRRVEEAIESLIEPEAWTRQIDIQQVEMNSISEFLDHFKSLPREDRA